MYIPKLTMKGAKNSPFYKNARSHILQTHVLKYIIQEGEVKEVNMNQIGIKVKELREKNNMTRTELARKAGYKNGSMIKSIEEGKRTPSFEKNLDIAKALGVSVSELVGKGSLSKNEKIVLGCLKGFVDELPESELMKGIKCFRLVYDAYLGRNAKEELNKVTDKLSLEAFGRSNPYIGEIKEDLDDDIVLNLKEVIKDRKKSKVIVKVEKDPYLVEIYIDGELFSKEEGDSWETPSRMGVTLVNNALERVPELLDSDDLTIYTDNEYLRKGINIWVDSWEKSGWKKSDGEKIAFKTFWEKIRKLKKEMNLKAVKLEAGHGR